MENSAHVKTHSQGPARVASLKLKIWTDGSHSHLTLLAEGSLTARRLLVCPGLSLTLDPPSVIHHRALCSPMWPVGHLYPSQEGCECPTVGHLRQVITMSGPEWSSQKLQTENVKPFRVECGCQGRLDPTVQAANCFVLSGRLTAPVLGFLGKGGSHVAQASLRQTVFCDGSELLIHLLSWCGYCGACWVHFAQ